MSTRSVGFIGGGRITRILLEGWQRANALPAAIVVSDVNDGVLSKLKARFPAIAAASDNTAAAAQDVVILAVHPPAMPQVAGGVRSSLKPGAVVVSLAPKFTIAKLSELLGGFARLARLIPNAPSLIGAGYNPMSFAPALSASDRSELMALFSPLGECPEVQESDLEAYAVLTAMGPTYLWFQLQALRELAADLGLGDGAITPALKRMVCGSTRTLLEAGLPAAEVLDLIPVKPLAEMEPQVTGLYRTRLPALYQKIRP